MDWDPGFDSANPKHLFYYLSVNFYILLQVIMLKHHTRSHIESCSRLFQILLEFSHIGLVSTLTSLPVPFAKKKPQNIRLPPPCFIVGIVFLGLRDSPFFLWTKEMSLWQKSSILVSSDYKTDDQKQVSLSIYFLAKYN